MIKCNMCYNLFIEDISFDTLLNPKLFCNTCLNSFEKPGDVCEFCYHPKGYNCCDKSIRNISLFIENQFLKDTLYQIKYLNLVHKIFIFEKFVKDIVEELFSNYVVIPVPVSRIMKNKRGFNQSYILATFTKLKIYNCIERLDNNTQSQKTYVERVTNPPKFKLLYLPKHTNILIIDDIYTTGSTLKSIYDLFPKNYNIKFLTIQRSSMKKYD